MKLPLPLQAHDFAGFPIPPYKAMSLISAPSFIPLTVLTA